MTRLHGKVDKGWGWEDIFVSNDKYCGKFLCFNEGARFSMHFHREKLETWYIMSGRFELESINTSNAEIFRQVLSVSDTITIHPLTPHRLTCLEQGTILEISTPDSVEDNYRVMPGDSQKKD